ncbi:MAG TPA: hypothetical protein VIK69_04980 [Methylophilaceae bacterium]
MYPSSLPNIDLQVLPTFPAHVGVTGVLTLVKSGLSYTFGVNFQNVAEETNVSDMSKREVLVQDTDTGAFWRVKLTNLPTGQTDWAHIQNKPATFPSSPHTHPVAEISDATVTGQSLVTAADAAAARAAIGAVNKAGDTITGNLAVGGEFTYGKAKNISGTDLDTLTTPGFYDGNNLANAPNGNSGWFYIEVQRHSPNDDFVCQRATALNHSGYATWVRNRNTGVWDPWRLVWDGISLAVISQAEAEAGVATTPRAWSAQRVKQAIEALAPGDKLLGDGTGTRRTFGIDLELDPADTTGSTAANEVAHNFIYIPSDTVDASAGGTPHKVDGFSVLHRFGGAGTRGGRHAGQFRLFLDAPTESNNPDRHYTALVGQVMAFSSDGGTVGAEKGAIFGSNFYARAHNGATNFVNVTGCEFNVGIDTGGSSVRRSGLSVVALEGHERGSQHDCGISITRLGGPGDGVPFKAGISIGAQNGQNALGSDSTVLEAKDATNLAYGIDFTGVTFSQEILSALNVRLNNQRLQLSAQNASVTLGASGVSNTPALNFRSGATAAPNYDARLSATGGNGTDGGGIFQVICSTMAISGTVRPIADDVPNLGDGAFRWKQVFAANGTINTSDETLKTPFRSLTEKEREALLACREHIGLFQWLSALEREGDDARLHAGVPAQKCIAEFEKRGLDPWKYAWFCRDRKIEKRLVTKTVMVPVFDEVEQTETVIEMVDGKAVQKEIVQKVKVPRVRTHQVVDEAGNPILKDVCLVDELEDGTPIKRWTKAPATYDEIVMEPREETAEEEIETDEWVYSIRYTELAMAMMAASFA